MCKAKELAASGNVRELEVFASSEVSLFVWSKRNIDRERFEHLFLVLSFYRLIDS